MEETKIPKVSSVQIPPSYSLRKTGITQSMLNRWEQCPVAFLLMLNGYKSKQATRRTGFGSMFHDMVDKLYSYSKQYGKPPTKKRVKHWLNGYCRMEAKRSLIAKRPEEVQRDRAVAYVLLTEYIRYYPEDFKEKSFLGTEEVFDVLFEYDADVKSGRKFARCRGKKDARYKSGDDLWIVETKTMGKISLTDLQDVLPLDNQNLFYVVMDEEEYGMEVAGVLYNIIRNPAHRISSRDHGSIIQFMKRLRKIVRKDPEHFFIRFEIPYTRFDKNRYRRELKIKLREIQLLLKGKLEVYRRTTNCIRKWRCDYLDACTTNRLSMYTKGKLFEELT